MDIKNLLCSRTIDNSVVLEDHQFDKSSPSQDAQQPWSTLSLASSCSSSADSPSSCFSSPPSPSPSPPASPAPLPPLLRSDTAARHFIVHRPARNTPQTRTPWTPKEDYLLEQGYTQGMSWAMISATYLPHRSRGCCWGRFKTLQTKASEQRDWSAEEERLLLLAVKKHSHLFKQAWKAVAQDLGNRSWKECELRSVHVANSIRKKQTNRGL